MSDNEELPWDLSFAPTPGDSGGYEWHLRIAGHGDYRGDAQSTDEAMDRARKILQEVAKLPIGEGVSISA